MITINVLLKVKAEKEQDYLAFLDDMVQKSRQDDGCLFYDHFRNVKHHNEYIIVENWADDESVEKHNQTTHLKTFLEKNSCLFGRGNCTKNQPQLSKVFSA